MPARVAANRGRWLDTAPTSRQPDGISVLLRRLNRGRRPAARPSFKIVEHAMPVRSRLRPYQGPRFRLGSRFPPRTIRALLGAVERPDLVVTDTGPRGVPRLQPRRSGQKQRRHGPPTVGSIARAFHGTLRQPQVHALDRWSPAEPAPLPDFRHGFPPMRRAAERPTRRNGQTAAIAGVIARLLPKRVSLTSVRALRRFLT